MFRRWWYGRTRSDTSDDREATIRCAFADAAQACNWPRVFELASEHPDFINCCRLGGTSLAAPLHQAAHAGAPVQVVQRLIELGAWRTLRNARGERPVDIAERRGHHHLRETLQPLLKRHVPPDVLLKIQVHFHEVILGQIRAEGLRLPELEPLLEVDWPSMCFDVPRMCGGFVYRLDAVGVEAMLVSESWSRGVDGAGERHEITSEGSRLVEEGL